MIEIAINLPAQLPLASIPVRVEQVCADEHLNCSLRSTLAAYPGSIHWHFKQGKQRGTLEITWWEPERRLWFKVAAGRTGAWIDAAVLHLKARLEQEADGL